VEAESKAVEAVVAVAHLLKALHLLFRELQFLVLLSALVVLVGQVEHIAQLLEWQTVLQVFMVAPAAALILVVLVALQEMVIQAVQVVLLTQLVAVAVVDQVALVVAVRLTAVLVVQVIPP
jgi:hypothetical protein